MRRPVLTLSNIPITIYVVILVFIVDMLDMQDVDASLTPRNETKIGISNSTLPERNNSESAPNGNIESRNCQMPACPPGEMCIQVCPESVPE